jgi:DNA-binding GntR family transcriptional regulator
MEALLSTVSNENGASDAKIIDTDESFHEIMYEATDNQFLWDSLTVLLSLNERLWYFFLSEIGGTQGNMRDHQAILRSLRAGDGEQAAALIERHINRLQEQVGPIILGQKPGK